MSNERTPARSRRLPERGRVAIPAILCAAVMGLPAAAQAPAKKAAPRLAPDTLRVFKPDKPVTGIFEFKDPMTGRPRRIEIRQNPGDSRQLVGILRPEGTEVLSLAPRATGVGYEGLLRDLLKGCGQDRVPVTDFLPLGDQIILRMDAEPPEVGCPFLDNPETAKLIVAPTQHPIRLMGSGDITSEATRSQLGLEGQPGGPSTPIVPGSVLLEGGSEVKFLGRAKGLDGSVWIEVEAIISPAAGVEPPRGYLRPGQLKVAASLTLRRETSGS